MNLAQHAWEAGSIERVLELLEQHRPKAGESDLRGFEWYYLYRLCHAELLTLKGRWRQRGLQPGRQTPGQRSGTDTVKVWDAQTGQELLVLKGTDGRSVAFSPDGKRLASALVTTGR